MFSVLGFGGGGGSGDVGGKTPFNEKEHSNFLTGALRRASSPHGYSEGEDGDVEDANDGAVRNSKGKQKRRSFRPSEKEDTSNSFSTRTRSPVSELHSRPVTPSGLNSNAHADVNSPHRYPPTANPARRHSWDEGDTTLVTAANTAAKVLKTAVLHDARNIKGKDVGLKALAWNVNSTHEAKVSIPILISLVISLNYIRQRLAKSIYFCLKDRKRIYLIPSDFYPAFPTHSDAEAAFRVFDKDGNGDISRSEIKSTLLKVYKERRFLSRSMRDVGVALKTLDHVLLFFAFAILFFISLSIFGVEVGDSLTSVYTIGIGASFVFKNAASNAFDAIMFLFVTQWVFSLIVVGC
jgi:hypothetical protein